MERTHFEQAKIWLESAKETALKENREKYSVGIAMLIHSVIKANDALTMKFLNTTAKRHDDAKVLFQELIKRNFIKAEYSNYKDIIQEAINNKAKAEYRAGYFSKNDFDDLLRKSEKFIKMCKEVLIYE